MDRGHRQRRPLALPRPGSTLATVPFASRLLLPRHSHSAGGAIERFDGLWRMPRCSCWRRSVSGIRPASSVRSSMTRPLGNIVAPLAHSERRRPRASFSSHIAGAAIIAALGFFLLRGAQRPDVWAGFSLLGVFAHPCRRLCAQPLLHHRHAVGDRRGLRGRTRSLAVDRTDQAARGAALSPGARLLCRRGGCWRQLRFRLHLPRSVAHRRARAAASALAWIEKNTRSQGPAAAWRSSSRPPSSSASRSIPMC